MRELTLLSACNADLLFAAAVSWHALRHHAPRYPLRVFVYLAPDVSDTDGNALRTFAETQLDLRVTTVRDADLPVAARQRLDRMVGGRAPGWRPAMARLVLPAMVQASHALYLDVDTLAVDDVSDVWDLDLEGAVVGAVQAPLAAVQGRVGADPYLNSGMLWIDVAAWEAHDISGRCEAWITADGGRSEMADQDALNVVLHPSTGEPRWHPVDPGYNVLTPMFLPRGPVVYDLPARARILHFAGSSKPWNEADHPFAKLYAQHLAAVPFRPLVGATGLF